MPIFSKAGMEVLFIHIPKTGGTTIEESFCAERFSMSYRRGGYYGPILGFDRDNGCPPQHMHAPLLEKHMSHLRRPRQSGDG